MSHSTHLGSTRRGGKLKLNKPQAVKRPAARGAGSHEERHAMIAEAAYYLAEHRGFESGHELDDWLLAGSHIDAVIAGRDSPRD
jgi:hypothetical protein